MQTVMLSPNSSSCGTHAVTYPRLMLMTLGISPSFSDMGLAIEQAIVTPQGGGTGPTPDPSACKRQAEVTSLEHQLVLSYCWLALKVVFLQCVWRRCFS